MTLVENLTVKIQNKHRRRFEEEEEEHRTRMSVCSMNFGISFVAHIHKHTVLQHVDTDMSCSTLHFGVVRIQRQRNRLVWSSEYVRACMRIRVCVYCCASVSIKLSAEHVCNALGCMSAEH